MLIALMAIAAMLTIAVSAATPAHLHTKSPGTQCDICITAHVPSSQAAALIQPFHGPQEHAGIFVAAVAPGYCSLNNDPSTGRGPPSL